MAVTDLAVQQVHYDELIRTLAKRTEHIHTRLLRYMLDNHSEFLRNLSGEYESIAERLVRTPVDTADLMELIGTWTHFFITIIVLYYAAPDVSGDGVLFSIDFFVSLLTRLREITAGPICMKFSGKVWSEHGTT